MATMHGCVTVRILLLPNSTPKYPLSGFGLKRSLIIQREPYLFPAGNVRVTIDYNLRTALHCTDFLNPECITIPAGDAPIILEVKWDAYLPDIVRDVVRLNARSVCAFSKYAACRIYG